MYDNMNFSPCPKGFFRQPPQGMQTPPSGGFTMPGMGGQQGAPMFPPIPAIGTTLPTGAPLGPTTGGATPVPGFTAPVPTAQPGISIPSTEISPTTTTSILYTPGYMRTQIGRKVRVEFLIGTSSMTDRTGTLIGVGASYILIRLEETDDIMLCDLYSIKFVTFFY